MEEIFVSFVGRRDPFTEEGREGPVLTCLSSERFRDLKKIILFHTRDRVSSRRAKELELEILKRLDAEVQIQELPLEDPTDLVGIYRELRAFFLRRNRQFPQSRYVYFLSSGTPQMQFSFLLLAGSGEFEGILIYQPDPRYGKPLTEIRLDHEPLPRISPPAHSPEPIEIPHLPEEVLREAEACGIYVGKSPAFRKALAELYAFARDERNVLLLGETGSGKELMASLYHRLSPRRDRRLIAINVTNLPETLFESELFGHIKGAFTGAHADKPGLIEEARDGILFLDEIGELKPDLQAKLLRLIENREYRKVGSTKIERAENVIFIFATNRNLKEEVRKGTFREDLFHRLYHFRIYIPPLRERREDIEGLTKHFLRLISQKCGRDITISDEALEKLKNYSFPGNIRELKSLLERASSLATGGIIYPQHLELESEKHPRELLPHLPYEGFDLNRTCEQIREWYYRKAYFLSRGSPTRAGRLLSCTHASVIKYWKKLGLLPQNKDKEDE